MTQWHAENSDFYTVASEKIQTVMVGCKKAIENATFNVKS